MVGLISLTAAKTHSHDAVCSFRILIFSIFVSLLHVNHLSEYECARSFILVFFCIYWAVSLEKLAGKHFQ
jgi:hypothetical protein